MPELPEVETIRRQLAPVVEGRTVERLEIIDPRLVTPEDPGEFARAVDGNTVEQLSRRGKYLVWELSGAGYLLVHLRMTGTLLYDIGDLSHTRAVIRLSDGGRITFVDPRRFGTAQLVTGAEERDRFFGDRLGIEPFSPEFTPELLRELLRSRRTPIKAALLDQQRIAGIGNIYADEALFRARMHPLHPAGTLRRPQIERLHRGILDSLTAGIEARGASIDDFRHVDGARGSFQNEFLVHRREGRPCSNCATPVKKIRAAGRGTYLCPECQSK